MKGEQGRRSVRRLALGLLLGSALVAGCGTDTPTTVYDCCATGVYYVCPSKATWGLCDANPHDVSGCTLQFNQRCPPGTVP